MGIILIISNVLLVTYNPFFQIYIFPFLYVFNVVSIDSKGKLSNRFGFNVHSAYLEKIIQVEHV